MDISMTESTLSTTAMSTTSQRAQVQPSYESCIRIDGRPILPPLMTQEKRRQMNHYKQLAVALEEKKRKKLETTFTTVSAPLPIANLNTTTTSINPEREPEAKNENTDLLKFETNQSQFTSDEPILLDLDLPFATSTPIRPQTSTISPIGTPLISRSGTRIYFDQSSVDDGEGKNKTTVEVGPPHASGSSTSADNTSTDTCQSLSPEKFGTTTLDDIDNNNKEVQLLVKRLSDINIHKYASPVPVPVQKLIDVDEGSDSQSLESHQLQPAPSMPVPSPPPMSNICNKSVSAPPSGRKKKTYFDDSFDNSTSDTIVPGIIEKHVHFPDANIDEKDKNKENNDPTTTGGGDTIIDHDGMTKYEDHFTIRKPYFSSPPSKDKDSSFESATSPKTTQSQTSATLQSQSQDSDSEYEDNSFASLPSSTATFIISRTEDDPNSTKSSKKTDKDKSILSEQALSEGEIVEDDHHEYQSHGSGAESDDEWSNLNSSYASVSTAISTITTRSVATPFAETPLGRVGLAQLHSRFKEFSPSFYKTSEGMSPLLKGVIFSEPLNRREVFRLPQKVFDPAMAPKFERLTATAKGYLVRRLLRTEKVQNIIQTIKDTVELLLKLYDEAPTNSRGETQIKQEDKDLNTRLMQQLHSACNSFHNVFFKLSSKERMAIISTDRNKLRAKAIKEAFGGDPRTKSQRELVSSNTKKGMSNATVKSIQRRMTMLNPQNLRTPIGASKFGRPAPATAIRMGQGTSRPSTANTTIDLNRRISVKPKSKSNLIRSSRESLSSSLAQSHNRTYNTSKNSLVSTPPNKKRTGISKSSRVVDRRSTLTKRAWK